ncbi:MAG: hypothetical protein AAGF78_07165 [Pseudomonadota bacterium]
MASLTGLSDRIAYILCGAAGGALAYSVGGWLVSSTGREFSLIGFVALWLLWSLGLSLLWLFYSPLSGRNVALRRAQKAGEKADSGENEDDGGVNG